MYAKIHVHTHTDRIHVDVGTHTNRKYIFKTTQANIDECIQTHSPTRMIHSNSDSHVYYQYAHIGTGTADVANAPAVLPNVAAEMA